MTQYRTGGEKDILDTVSAGMPVYDRDGKAVGRVQEVYPGGLDPDSEELGVGSPSEPVPGMHEEGSLADAIEDTLNPVEAIEQQEDYSRKGFIRIDGANLSQSGHYILSDQIERVSMEGVHLRVSQDDLTNE